MGEPLLAWSLRWRWRGRRREGCVAWAAAPATTSALRLRGHLLDERARGLADRLDRTAALTDRHHHVDDNGCAVDDCVAVHLEVAERPLFVWSGRWSAVGGTPLQTEQAGEIPALLGGVAFRHSRRRSVLDHGHTGRASSRRSAAEDVASRPPLGVPSTSREGGNAGHEIVESKPRAQRGRARPCRLRRGTTCGDLDVVVALVAAPGAPSAVCSSRLDLVGCDPGRSAA